MSKPYLLFKLKCAHPQDKLNRCIRRDPVDQLRVEVIPLVTAPPESSNLSFISILLPFSKNITCFSGDLLLSLVGTSPRPCSVSSPLSTGCLLAAVLPVTGGRTLLSHYLCSRRRFPSASGSSVSRAGQFTCSRCFNFHCVELLSFASTRVFSHNLFNYSVVAKRMHKWFADSINLQIMLTDSLLSFKSMLS